LVSKNIDMCGVEN